VLSNQPQGGFITRQPTGQCRGCERRRLRLRLVFSAQFGTPKATNLAIRAGAAGSTFSRRNRATISKRHRAGEHQPRRAALIAATSIFFMSIMASNARFWLSSPPAAIASVARAA